MRKRLVVLAVATLVGLPLIGGCEKKKVIRNSGSDTMVNLAQVWAEEYHRVVTDVSVEISGGGSGTGIANLINGITDIANASRDMTADERKKIRDTKGADPIETMVGYDALGVYVHRDNPIDSLTLEQLAGIYVEGGGITKWSQLGVDPAKVGNDEIVVAGRQNSSGTYAYFREHVLSKKDFRRGINEMSGSKDVVELVGKTPGAIGYSGMGYKTDEVKFVKIAPKTGEPAYEATLENVTAGHYALARPLFLYTLPETSDEAKAYIQWILSDKGQDILLKEGYIPVSAVKKAAGQ